MLVDYWLRCVGSALPEAAWKLAALLLRLLLRLLGVFPSNDSPLIFGTIIATIRYLPSFDPGAHSHRKEIAAEARRRILAAQAG